MGGIQIFMYIALVFFIVGTAYKAIQISRMPLHLRWDLYPIPHEKGREEYGGSYFEQIDWWTKPAEVSIGNELKEMAKEILFIQSMYHNNRRLWIFSFPFHFGLYLSIVFVLLVYAGAILGLQGIAITADSTNTFGRLFYYLTIIFGLSGTVLAGIGSFGLLLSRMFTPILRKTSVLTDYINLIILFVVFATGFWTWVTIDTGFNGARAFITGLITFSPVQLSSSVESFHILFAAIFLFWLPFTHMTHFVGKYFTYHKVRWEDHPNIKGSPLEKTIAKALGYKIDWSAPHIKTGATWAEAATATGNEEKSNDEK